MLVRSKTRYVPTAVNMIVLQGEDGTYYYLHRALYDQCVVLRDQYINLLPSFYSSLALRVSIRRYVIVSCERCPSRWISLAPSCPL